MMKILYVTTVSSTMTFFTSHINMLLDQGHKVDLACNYDLPINQDLLDRGCRLINIKFQRSPMKLSNYLAIKRLKRLIQDGQYDLVHTHTPIASVCTRFAARNIKNLRIIYTAHGFHFYKGAPLRNWLIYYPIEKWLSKYTDVLITINKEDYIRAKRSFKAGKIEYIPGVGLETQKFSIIVDKFDKRREIEVPKEAFVILSVGELNNNKNHETVIKALANLKQPNVYYLICGIGHHKEYLLKLADSYGLGDRVKLLGFRKDVNEIYHASDIFVFSSFREGLSVALMESMAAGLPVVCTNIRGNMDLIEMDQGGFLVDPRKPDEFTIAIQRILEKPDLRVKMGIFNKEKVKQFNLDVVLDELRKIYSTLGRV